MGGYGSGRKFGADCAEDCRSIDIRRWQRDGYLTPGQSFWTYWTVNGEEAASIGVRTQTGRVILSYRQRESGSDDWQNMEYPVILDWTPCNYGGKRAWFLCPAEGCGRRVALLYGGRVFACRHCYRLAYRSQREALRDRKARRADKIRTRLGWPSGILNSTGGKPKGMHWRTFERLQLEHDDFAEQSLIGMMRHFKITI